MRRLLLMRHAKTEKDGPTGRDRDRRLDDRGRREAEEMSNYLARHELLPDLALVSTAVRARQTWDRAAAAWPDIAVDHLDDLYGADAGDLLRIIRTAGGKASRRLLVVGHNPGLHELALALIAGGDVESRQALLENLPTSGIAVIDFSIKDWSDVSFRRGRLDRFVSPRLLRRADDV
jgi:phosphohistidine phosphatase